MTIKKCKKDEAVQFIIANGGSYLLGLNAKDIDKFIIGFKKVNKTKNKK